MSEGTITKSKELDDKICHWFVMISGTVIFFSSYWSIASDHGKNKLWKDAVANGAAIEENGQYRWREFHKDSEPEPELPQDLQQ